MRVALPLIACAFALVASPSALADDAPADRPVEKIDRSKVIGAPVLERAPRGIHLWLEDGWYQLAAVTALPLGTKVTRKTTFAVTVRCTRPITTIDFERWSKAGGTPENITLHVVAGPDPERMRFKTDGELTVLDAKVESGGKVPLFVGPLARPAASTVRIGRY